MAEIAPAGGGPNRLFVVIAIGLVGLLLLGLVAVGGILIIPRVFQTTAVSPTVRVAVATATRVLAPAVAPTATDTPAPTATAVLAPPTAGPTSTATVAITATGTITGTPGTGTPSSDQLPQSGMGEDLLLLAAGVVLVLIIFAARRARATGAA